MAKVRPIAYDFLAFAIALLIAGQANANQSKASERQIWNGLLPFLNPSDRNNVAFIDGQCGVYGIPSSLTNDIWQAPSAPKSPKHCYLHHTGEKFTLRNIPNRPLKPLLFAPEKGASASEIQTEFGSEFRARSGPFRRVLSHLPTPKRPGYSWLSVNVVLPPGNDVTEDDDDNACIYCGGWGGRGGAVDAGFVHSKGRHNWALFIRRQISATDNEPTGQTFSLKTRFKEGQTVKLTLYVPKNDMVAISAEGLNETGAQMNRTIVVAMDTQFGWRSDGKANILKRVATIAQDKEDFSRNEKVVGIHWSSPTAAVGPCRIGWNWRNNHDWSTRDSEDEDRLRIFETWPLSFNGRKIVFVEENGAGEETEAIILAGAQQTPKPSNPAPNTRGKR